ncbi:hypothetical protein [Alkalicoccobacillus plakortidis]|uniref:Uncharacterized protein n=1 Tax=Alkalicoccobacillus plakortidis TaxID=444060 RepID=A0ABT0XLS3_9BACI|nr:hypothetical protein [Alkalicoccobacillus plakortidis]MCM2676864.1 hypothetical protein [Alkalicoccobacillus plakortidis]
MFFEYTAPAIARSDKSFIIEHDNREIGQLERYFTKQTSKPEYDVNIVAKEFTSSDEFKIEQTEIKLFGRTKWEIYKNEKIIGEAEFPKGFFKSHQIVMRIDDHPIIIMKINSNGTATLMNEDEEEIGSSRRTSTINRSYEGEIDDDYVDMPLILFYSLVHTFWCASHIE